MKPLKKLQFLAGYWLIWMGLFELARGLFILYNHKYRAEAGWADLMMSFWNGFKMDASAASYIIAPCSLIMIAAVFFSGRFLKSFLKIYSWVILIPLSLIILCDLPAYGAWGYRLDATPMKYLSNPGEAWASVSHLPVFSLLAVTALIYYLLGRLFSRYIEANAGCMEKNQQPWLTSLLMLLFTAMLIVPIRGGFQLAPLNQSSVYKSSHHFVNISSLNAAWNFLNSLSLGIKDDNNPFAYLPAAEAHSIRRGLMEEKGNRIPFLDSSVSRPNIILITWESFTSKSLGKMKSAIPVVPGFESLISESLFFENVFATGDRTEKGVLGVLSGYPSLPTVNMMRIPEKHSRLNTLPETLSDRGYRTSFYYGGELEFANMKSYLLKAGFAGMTEKNDFAEEEQNSKWGAHDHVVSARIKQDLDTMKEPFFINWLTLSSHEPFETGLPPVIQGSDDESLFFNSLHYTDSVVYDFIRFAKSKPWWKNTVVIIIADHGHKLPYTGRRTDDFRIPMLWTGGALLKKGVREKRIINQTDLASSLCSQLNIQSDFPWSRDISRDTPLAWAYFSFKNGFGWVEPGAEVVYDNVGKKIIEARGNTNKDILNKGFSLQQLSYDDFLGKGLK